MVSGQNVAFGIVSQIICCFFSTPGIPLTHPKPGTYAKLGTAFSLRSHYAFMLLSGSMSVEVGSADTSEIMIIIVSPNFSAVLYRYLPWSGSAAFLTLIVTNKRYRHKQKSFSQPNFLTLL